MYRLESPTVQASALPCTTQGQAQACNSREKMDTSNPQNSPSATAIEQTDAFATIGTRYSRIKARLQEKKRRSEALRAAQEKADLACESLRKTFEAREQADEFSCVLIDKDEAEWDIIDYADADISRSALERARADLEASLGA